jgi:OOP family OmpA-OmpF porin
MHRGWSVIAALFILVLAGCAGLQYNQVKGMQPKGSAFDQELFKSYVAFSKAEYEGGGYASSDRWAKEAAMAANGQTPRPTQVSDWKLPPGVVPEMTTARQRLQAVLDKGGATVAPIETARAQVAWDCWCQKQQVSENFQTDAIANCRKLFYDNLAKAETAVAPKPAAVKTEPAKDYLVFFDWNKATLTPEARRIVADAMAYAKSSGAKMIRVVGYTDRSGTPRYNLKLSVRRAEAVREEIKRLGVPATTVEIEGKGESDPLVPTPDGVREPQNRRAVISFTNMGASLDPDTDTTEVVYLDVVY